MQPDPTRTLEARLGALEAQNRTYRWILGSLVALCLIGYALQATPTEAKRKPKDVTFGTIQAERLALMDGGKVDMLLSSRGEGSKISLHGPAGKPRMTLSVKKNGSAMVSLNGKDQKPRLTLRFNETDGPVAIFYDENGKAFKVIKR